MPELDDVPQALQRRAHHEGMRTVRAFTGPTHLTSEQTVWAIQQINKLEPVDEVHTGAAIGLDTLAATTCVHKMPNAKHVIFVPAAPYDQRIFRKMYIALNQSHGFTVVKCPSIGLNPANYRKRNEMMLDGATELCAFATSDKFYRSGEWMTINIARKADIPVHLFVLTNGEES